MTQEELIKILEEHKLWLESDGAKGKQADLGYVNLYDFNLSNADLRHANLTCADLCYVDLSFANLEGANLRFADLRDANLFNANLVDARLYSADLCDANLKCANLSNTDLSNANLSYANLSGANLVCATLCGADLNKAVLDEKEQIRKGIILQEEMIGWKKGLNDVLIKLEIPRGAIVFSINNNKCRTNKAKVVEILDSDDNIAISQHDENFSYRLDEMVEVEDFDCQYNVECGSGIHFFRTKEEAINY